MDGKIEGRAYITFCVKISKSTSETLEMFREAFGEHSVRRKRYLNGVHFSRQVECQLKMNFQGDQASVNTVL
jgi:hypothetical protein